MKRTLSIGASLMPLSLLALSLLSASAPASPAATYNVAKDAGAGEDALRGAIDALFADDVGTTRALVVMRRGRIVAERYAPGFGPDTPLPSWSMAKSVTAVLAGLMASDGRLVLDSPAPVPGWSQPGDPRGQITLRHLLTMSSGLEHDEDGPVIAARDSMRMMFTDGARDMAAFAEDKPLAAPPGSRFVYSTATSTILADIMTRALTDATDADARRAAMADFIRQRLAVPVGLDSLVTEYDARGTLIGGAFMHMTARDYGRFGELLRNHGRVGGRQILAPRWVDFMTAPSRRNPAYGGHVWLNRVGAQGNGAEGRLFPDTSSRIFAAVGYEGQYVIVAPDQELTVVRLGISSPDERKPLAEALGRLIGLFG